MFVINGNFAIFYSYENADEIKLNVSIELKSNYFI